jgi:hypothetical protein
MNNFQKLAEELTDENYHTEALIVKCLEFSRFDLIQHLAILADLHEQQGFITKEQQEQRAEIEKRIESGV